MPTLQAFLHRYPGSSIPSAIRCTDGSTLVLKMKGAGNGTQSLVAEFVVNRAAQALGWPLPQAYPVAIPQDFPWEFGTDEFDDILQKSYGVNLGLQHLGECSRLNAAEMLALPRDLLVKMATLDAFFLNYDRLAASQNVLKDAEGRVWLIDHGSCLFVDPDLAGKPAALAPGHLLGAGPNELIDASLAPGILASAQAAVSVLPQGWLDELALSEAQLRDQVAARAKAFQR